MDHDEIVGDEQKWQKLNFFRVNFSTRRTHFWSRFLSRFWTQFPEFFIISTRLRVVFAAIEPYHPKITPK
jgi:hypothetical protein